MIIVGVLYFFTHIILRKMDYSNIDEFEAIIRKTKRRKLKMARKRLKTAGTSGAANTRGADMASGAGGSTTEKGGGNVDVLELRLKYGLPERKDIPGDANECECTLEVTTQQETSGMPREEISALIDQILGREETDKTQKEKLESMHDEAVRVFLLQADYWSSKVLEYREALEMLLANKYNARSKSVILASSRKCMGRRDKGIENMLSAEDTLNKLLNNAVANLERSRREINEALDSIGNEQVAETLRLAYIAHKSSADIGRRLNVSGRQIRRRKAQGYKMIKLPASWEKAYMSRYHSKEFFTP